MCGKARFAAPLDVLFLAIAAQRDGGERMSPRAQLPKQIVAAAVRQPEIADEQVKALPAGQFQRRGHVPGRLDHVAIRGQHRPHHLRRDAVVLGQ